MKSVVAKEVVKETLTVKLSQDLKKAKVSEDVVKSANIVAKSLGLTDATLVAYSVKIDGIVFVFHDEIKGTIKGSVAS